MIIAINAYFVIFGRLTMEKPLHEKICLSWFEADWLFYSQQQGWMHMLVFALLFEHHAILCIPHCHRPEAFYQILTCLIWALWVHVKYLLTKCVTESCDSPDWLIQYCLSSASSHATETVSMKMPCGECFQKCFSANNMISLWLNTVIPIIVMIWLLNMTRYLQWRIIYRHLTLVTF